MSTLSNLLASTVAAIQALPAVSGWTVSSAWVPEFDRETIAKGVYVSPEERSTAIISRACKERTATLLVACVDVLAKDTFSTQIQTCDALAESIGDGLLGQKLDGMLCLKAESVISIRDSTEHARSQRLALFFVRLSFKGS